MLNLNSRYMLHMSYDSESDQETAILYDNETNKQTYVTKSGSSYILDDNELGLSGTAEQIFNQLDSLYWDLDDILSDEWMKTVSINNSLYNGNLTIYGAIVTTAR